MDFAVPADHRVKLKESEKKDKYLELTREFFKKYIRKQWTAVSTLLGLITSRATSSRVVARSISTGGDHGILCLSDLIR